MSKKILVVDDEYLVRSLLMAVLEAEGYAMFEASNGLEGGLEQNLQHSNKSIVRATIAIRGPQEQAAQHEKEQRSDHVNAPSLLGIKTNCFRDALQFLAALDARHGLPAQCCGKTDSRAPSCGVAALAR